MVSKMAIAVRLVSKHPHLQARLLNSLGADSHALDTAVLCRYIIQTAQNTYHITQQGETYLAKIFPAPVLLDPRLCDICGQPRDRKSRSKSCEDCRVNILRSPRHDPVSRNDRQRIYDQFQDILEEKDGTRPDYTLRGTASAKVGIKASNKTYFK